MKKLTDGALVTLPHGYISFLYTMVTEIIYCHSDFLVIDEFSITWYINMLLHYSDIIMNAMASQIISIAIV